MQNSGTKNPFLDFTKLPAGMETNKSAELSGIYKKTKI
jgi:hypothetical protein